MNPSLSCNAVEERIAVGETLDEASQAHVLGCRRCSAVAADYLALDARVEDELANTVIVPEGFADRVMAALQEAPASHLDHVLGRRWVQIALAHVGAAVALTNLLRFVFSSLVPSATLGGAP